MHIFLLIYVSIPNKQPNVIQSNPKVELIIKQYENKAYPWDAIKIVRLKAFF